MIKAEVVFDGDVIIFGSFSVLFGFECADVYRDGKLVNRFESVEKAIKYCLEN